MSTIKAFTARQSHSCETCDRKDVNGSFTKAIRPGHRYLSHTVFPGDEGFEEGRQLVSLRECAECAIGRDDDTVVSFGICGTYCCGTHPCALPFGAGGAPGHDHQCSQCPAVVR